MEPCKKYVTCIMTFFIPFTSVSYCQFNFVQVLHSYLRYTDWHSDVLFLLLPVILSELQTKKERLSQRKTHIEVCEGHDFFGNTSYSYVIFYRFFHLSPSTSRVTYWLHGPCKET